MTRSLRIAIGLASFIAIAWGSDQLFARLHVHFSSAVFALLVVLGICFARRGVDVPLERGAHVLLRWFPLFFVPACVGVLHYTSLLSHVWLGLIVALVCSSVAGIVVAALVGTVVARAVGRTAA